MIGLLGRKKGMTSIFVEGRHTPVTVLEMGPCTVMDVKTREKDSYDAVKLAFGDIREKLVSRPCAGQFKSAGIEPHRVVKELRDFQGDYKPGSVLTVDMFSIGDRIKVTGVSKGRGFAGVIKRHNFSCPNRSHGTHEAFRGPGSIGQHSSPARVWPGRKMAGRMGGKRVSVKNLVVVDIDSEKGFLLVRGAIPGAPGGLVTVRKIG